jgi:hypothetical protein
VGAFARHAASHTVVHWRHQRVVGHRKGKLCYGCFLKNVMLAAKRFFKGMESLIGVVQATFRCIGDS